jgi:hypothetical protein
MSRRVTHGAMGRLWGFDANFQFIHRTGAEAQRPAEKGIAFNAFL